MRKNKNIQPMRFGVYFSIVTLIALVGLIDSIYLSISHFRVYSDVDYSSFCAISKAINCDTVSQSPYSIVLNVPVPIWGVVGYVIVLTLLANAWRQRHSDRGLFWPSLFILSLVYSLNSVLLAAISAALIRSHCIMCIVSHAVNFSLLFYSWLIHRRFADGSIFSGLKHDIRLYKQQWRIWTAGLSGLVGLVLVMNMHFPTYWDMEMTIAAADLNRGVTAEGYPWVGATDPEFVITEFSDYQCFQCKKMHLFLRRLVAEHKDSLRLVHRHFPMDDEYNPMVTEPFHPGSGKMAMIALFAQEKGQFWKVNDLLFELAATKADFNTRTVAEKMDITSGELSAALDNKYLRLRLKHDIAIGIVEGIRGTPGFIIDGQVYTGTIPPDVLRKIISKNAK